MVIMNNDLINEYNIFFVLIIYLQRFVFNLNKNKCSRENF